MFHLAAYNIASDTAAATNADMLASTDGEFSQRNSHLIFTEQYKLLTVQATSTASLTRGRFQVPTWNAIGEFTIFNVQSGLSPASNFQLDSYLAYPPSIPQEEEFQIQMSNAGAGTIIENASIIIGTQDWNQNLPQGVGPPQVLQIRASFTVTPTLNAWSGGQNITLSAALRGGVYAVVGAQLQGINAVWFRLIFPRMRMYMGRKLRPGSVVQNAISNVPNLGLPNYPFTFGEWGRFHSFELPTCEVFGSVAGSATYQLFLWLVYLGQPRSILDQWSMGG